MSLHDCNSAAPLLQGSSTSPPSCHPLHRYCATNSDAQQALLWLLNDKKGDQDETVPDGYVSVKPMFLPKTKKGGADGERGEKATAISNLPHEVVPGDSNISKMVALQDVVAGVVRDLGQARLSVALVTRATERGLTYQGERIKHWGEIRLAYCNELSADMLEILYDVLYGQWYMDHRARMDSIVTAILEELKIHVMKADQEGDDGKMSDKNSFHHTLQNKFRDSFRNNLFKKGRCKHGVKLTVTQPKEFKWKGSAQFRFDYHVKGWNGEAHKNWLQSSGKGQPESGSNTAVPTSKKVQKKQPTLSNEDNPTNKNSAATRKSKTGEGNSVFNVIHKEDTMDSNSESDSDENAMDFGGRPDPVSF